VDSHTPAPFIILAFTAYAALLALAWLARMRYRTLAALLLASAALLTAAYVWLGGAKGRVQAPALAAQAIAALYAQPWPADAPDLARLIASLHGLRDVEDEAAARFAYTRFTERNIAGEPPLAFKTVGEGLRWIHSLPAHNDKSAEWREIDEIRRKAISRLIEVRFADTSGGWPPSLDKGYALRPGSRLVAPGIWAVDTRPTGGTVTLQYAVQVRNLGAGRVSEAHVTYRETRLAEPAESPRARGAAQRLFCPVHATDLDPGEIGYSRCTLETLPLDTPQAARQLEHLAQLRAGAIALEPMPGGSFQYALAIAPPAEPLPAARVREYTDTKTADAVRVHDRAFLRERVREWLIALGVLGAGYVIPGLRRGPIGIIGTLILGAAGTVASFACTFIYFKAQRMDPGWLPVISFFVSLFYGAVFVGGLLLASLALHQERNARA
jgi:hypothetical protein